MSEAVDFPQVAVPGASVIVIGWGRAPYLLGCLSSLLSHDSRVRYEVLLALNEPDPALLVELESSVSGAGLVISEENLGFGGVLNLAASQARAEYLVFVNDDTEVLDGWLDSLIEVADRRHAGAVGSRLLELDGSVQEAGGIIWKDGWTWSVGRNLPPDSPRFDYERQVDYCSASSLLVRRSSFEELGGFEPSYYPAYFEDADLCLRLSERGEPVWFAPRSSVRHFESASTTSRFREFLMARNHELFVDRWRTVLAEKEPRVAANEPAVDRAIWRAMGRPHRVLVIDDRTPNPAVGSGFPRMAQILAALQRDEDLQVSLYTTVRDGDKDRAELCQLGIAVVDEPLETHLARIGQPYECVLISRPHNYEHLAPLIRRATTAPIIYDAEALYFRRITLQAALAPDADARAVLERAAVQMRVVELDIASDANCTVCLSEEEAEFFRENGCGPVEVLPPLLEGIERTTEGFGERSDIGFVAGWLGGADSPNAASLEWFASEVLPLVRAAYPAARLLVTGVDPPATVLRLADDSLQFLGGVPELSDIYRRVRVVVSPMLYGAGVKNKTVEALQYGVPTVATTVGAEGIRLSNPDALIVSDDAATLAARIAELLTDDAAWQRQAELVRSEADAWIAGFDPTKWPQIVRRVIDAATPTGGLEQREPAADAVAGAAPSRPLSSMVRASSVAPTERMVREEYVSYLEAELDEMEKSLHDEHVLSSAEKQRSAELGHLVQEMRNQPSYRLAQVVARLGGRSRVLKRLAREIRTRQSPS